MARGVSRLCPGSDPHLHPMFVSPRDNAQSVSPLCHLPVLTYPHYAETEIEVQRWQEVVWHLEHLSLGYLPCPELHCRCLWEGKSAFEQWLEIGAKGVSTQGVPPPQTVSTSEAAWCLHTDQDRESSNCASLPPHMHAHVCSLCPSLFTYVLMLHIHILSSHTNSP